MTRGGPGVMTMIILLLSAGSSRAGCCARTRHTCRWWLRWCAVPCVSRETPRVFPPLLRGAVRISLRAWHAVTYRKAIPPRAELRSTEQLPGGAIEPGTLCDTLFAEQCPQLHLEKMHQTQMVERHRAGLGCHARSVACACAKGRGGVRESKTMGLWHCGAGSCTSSL